MLSSRTVANDSERFTVAPGRWTLKAAGQWSEDGTDATANKPLIEKRVDLAVIKANEQETVKITPVDPTDETDAIVGFIKEDSLKPGRILLDALGGDAEFEFRLIGEVKDTERVDGIVVGRSKAETNRGFQGRFQLTRE